MKCPHCQSEWKVSAGLGVTVQECPFCRKSLLPQPGAVDTMEGVLCSIRDVYGMNTLKSGKIMLSYFKDLAPKMKKERKMLAEFIDAGGPDTLFAAVKKPEGEQRIAVEKLILCLTEDHLMADSFARTVCTTYLTVIGGKVSGQPVQRAEKSPERAADPKPTQSSDFVITPDGVLTAYKGTDYRVVIPVGVKEIGEGVFANQMFDEIVFPSSLTHIHKNACSGLSLIKKDLVLPHGLTYIGDYAFQACGCQTVRLPETLTHIGEHAFEGVSDVKEITIPGGVKTVSDAAFFMCSGLESVTFQSGVETVEPTAFALCNSLKWIMVPASLMEIASGAFFNPISKEKPKIILTEPWKDPGVERFKNVQFVKL